MINQVNPEQSGVYKPHVEKFVQKLKDFGAEKVVTQEKVEGKKVIHGFILSKEGQIKALTDKILNTLAQGNLNDEIEIEVQSKDGSKISVSFSLMEKYKGGEEISADNVKILAAWAPKVDYSTMVSSQKGELGDKSEFIFKNEQELETAKFFKDKIDKECGKEPLSFENIHKLWNELKPKLDETAPVNEKLNTFYRSLYHHLLNTLIDSAEKALNNKDMLNKEEWGHAGDAAWNKADYYRMEVNLLPKERKVDIDASKAEAKKNYNISAEFYDNAGKQDYAKESKAKAKSIQ